MRLRTASALGAALAVGAAAPAAAAEVQIRGLDSLTWDRPRVTIAAGDTVRWTFAGTTQAHNVRSWSTNWSYASTIGAPAPDGVFTFTAEGSYEFYCQVHATTMRGTVTVGAAPEPEPPPPASEQPYPNDTGAPGYSERIDNRRPRISAVAVRGLRRSARVSFRVSERSRVVVRLGRRGRTASRLAVNLRRGRHGVGLGGLRPGAYRVRLVAVDRAGNRSRVKRARLLVR